jgi:UDP-N-acetylmuramoyl-L-alanyl-D-glutamate--2,6-diaminopimelate ligase
VLGRFAARVYGEPAAALRTIGVTGTQGKTTCTRLAESGLTGAGVTSAVVGTVGTRVAGTDVKTLLTTPEAPDLHGLFARMRERGVVACAMEVSSHALVMGRVDGVVFDVAVFLNLGLVDVDDAFGRRLVEQATVPVRTLSSRGHDADWRATDVALSATGSRFVVVGPDGRSFSAGVPLPGDFNVANTLAAIAACAEAGFDPQAVADGIAVGEGVPGRLERVDAGQDFVVVVDYAHKPDAVEAAIGTLRPLTDGRVIVVLGAGGDRDPGKRPMMGEIAARLADVLVVTDDNPRTEDPAAVRGAVLDGAAGGPAEVVEVAGRREAIREALRRARSGDIVLVAGKGHETGQEVAGVVHPFDDRDVVREELAELSSR